MPIDMDLLQLVLGFQLSVFLGKPPFTCNLQFRVQQNVNIGGAFQYFTHDVVCSPPSSLSTMRDLDAYNLGRWDLGKGKCKFMIVSPCYKTYYAMEMEGMEEASNFFF